MLGAEGKAHPEYHSQVGYKLQLPDSLCHTGSLNHATISVINILPGSYNYPGMNVKVELTGELC